MGRAKKSRKQVKRKVTRTTRRAAKRTTKNSKKAKKNARKSTTKATRKKITKKKVAKKTPKKKTTSTATRSKRIPAKTTRKTTSATTSTNAQVRQLEKENQKLMRQLEQQDTKEAVMDEVRTHINRLKEELAYQSHPEKNDEYNHIVEKLEDTNNKLVEQMTRTDSKDKIINKLKSLLAGQKKATPERIVNQPEEQQAVVTPVQQETKEEVPEEYREPEEEAPKPVPKKKQKPLSEDEFQSAKSNKGMITAEEATHYGNLMQQMRKEINKVFIGQEDVVEKVLISLMCDAHTLLEGVPGLAKTLLIETMAKTLGGTTFKRIQFLPDLLPSDIIGGQVFNPKTAEFKTFKGPIFANFVLADEINRAPPKTHAAVMEAMQEKKINIENDEFILDRPFFVLATQNPLENKGTYELPEAVLDRFMFKVILDYPARKDEITILTENATTKALKDNLKPIMNKQELLTLQKKVKDVFVSHRIKEFVLDLVEATRGDNKHIEGIKFVKYGAGVRAGIYLILSAKAKAVLEGRNYVLPDDVLSIAPSVLRHRISLNFRGKAHNISAEKIMEEIFMKVNIV